MESSKKFEEMVSIVMPAYCASALISESIESVINQSYTNWELIVVDDCSKDNTVDVVKKHKKYDKRIRLIEVKTNAGPANARNRALEIAEGRYIAFLDSDDIWLHNKLEVTLKKLSDSEADLAYTAYRRISCDGSETGHYISVPKSMTYKRLLSNSAIITSSVVYDTKRLGKYKMHKVYYDDFACWLEMLKDGAKSIGIDQDLLRYRVTGKKSVSGNKIKSALKVWEQLRTHEKLSYIDSLKSFLGYSVRGFIKHIRL